MNLPTAARHWGVKDSNYVFMALVAKVAFHGVVSLINK